MMSGQRCTEAHGPDSHVYGSGLSYTNVGADACIMQMFGGLEVTEQDGKWHANFENNQGISTS